MSTRDELIRRLSEDSMGGIATLHDVTEAEKLLDAYKADVLRELAELQEQTSVADVIRGRQSIATARRLIAMELRNMADKKA